MITKQGASNVLMSYIDPFQLMLNIYLIQVIQAEFTCLKLKKNNNEHRLAG